MSSKKIYLVRHGQTDYNLKGVVQGSGIDAPLNDTGFQQAKAFFDYYKDVPFDKVFYTGLQRTRQSIQGFLDLGLPFESIPDLNEISWGKYEGVPMTPSEHQYYQYMLHRWSTGDLNYAIDGGESPNQVAVRLKRGMDYILKQPCETILICMHGRAIRILMAVLLEMDLRYMDVFQHQNLGLYLLQTQGNGKFMIEKYNSGDHFKE
ncbi:histidine phosphatase family protein [Mongoliitalea daihaiensis]|uniref:histidine phosphatase family protein n=1 Tax=Mongoliitalea daihaiensis TaxID=2782006 RepID=UPI001F1732FE|nr:histidine phosphatase family protein [Mongoliitalea daihaiensis]UJP63240.1 histidine phosphatase family protein [Mongoliitalea daihaiensis]